MTMAKQEREKCEDLISRLTEENEPLMGSMVVFYEGGKIVYAGIISDWPMIITTDIEWGSVQELDSSKPPFAGKTKRYFCLLNKTN